MRGIHPDSAPLSEEPPGCQSDGIVKGIRFRWEIPGEDRAIIKEERNTMIRVAGCVNDSPCNSDLAEESAAQIGRAHV